MTLPKKTFRRPLLISNAFLSLYLLLVLTSCSHNYKHNDNFPAEIALAAYGKKETPKAEPQCEFNITDLKEPSKLDPKKLKEAVEKAKEEGPFTEEQAKEAIRIIKTGQFYKDISSAVMVTYGFWRQNVKNIFQLKIIDPRKIKCLPSTVLDELIDDQTLFSNTLKCVYENPTIKQAAETANILLQNESIRLAIIVYASANGVNLKNEDLDVLNETALDTDNPDLNALVDHGVERLKEEYGADKAEKILKAMKSGEMTCNNADSG